MLFHNLLDARGGVSFADAKQGRDVPRKLKSTPARREIAQYSKSRTHGCQLFGISWPSLLGKNWGRMDISIERRIDELCDLAAREYDYTKLKNVIEQLFECIDARQLQRDGARKISLS
jgi:hypothetical protein